MTKKPKTQKDIPKNFEYFEIRGKREKFHSLGFEFYKNKADVLKKEFKEKNKKRGSKTYVRTIKVLDGDRYIHFVYGKVKRKRSEGG